jgi:erythromycin esterase
MMRRPLVYVGVLLLLVTCQAERPVAEGSQNQAVVQWLSDNGIALKTVEAEQGFDDMQPLKEVVGEARIVALGEATHGTREFFQVKHRMLEFLVTEMDFNVFAIEAIMPEAFDVNEYVLTGRGDPEKALAALYFWTWNTREVLDMIRWMRRYNADPGHTRKVKFYGFDMQSGTRALKRLRGYLEGVDEKAAMSLEDDPSLPLIASAYTAGSFADQSDEARTEAIGIVTRIAEQLESEQEQYIGQTGKEAWDLARLHAQILSQFIRANSVGDDYQTAVAVRDRSMAENVRWILEHEGPDAKAVLWAHNYHVGDTKSGTAVSMGHVLRDIYGEAMVVFGFVFNQGCFQAVEAPFGRGSGVRPFHVVPLPEASLDATLAAAGLPFGVFDLRSLPETGQVAEWFAEPQETRSFGAGFNTEPGWGVSKRKVLELYDVLLFVNETTAALPNPGGARLGIPALAAPENLDFEVGDPGLVPESWYANKHLLANFGYTVATTTEKPFHGGQCVTIWRNPGEYYGEKFGNLYQQVDATPYRGKKIRLRAAVRTDLAGPDDHAYLWLVITKEGHGPDTKLFEDNMHDRPIATADWQLFEIVAEVPTEADWITFGPALAGYGRAWFDAFSLEVVR